MNGTKTFRKNVSLEVKLSEFNLQNDVSFKYHHLCIIIHQTGKVHFAMHNWHKFAYPIQPWETIINQREYRKSTLAR